MVCTFDFSPQPEKHSTAATEKYIRARYGKSPSEFLRELIKTHSTSHEPLKNDEAHGAKAV
jgi:pyruvate/oxaloacetate carboxyltransferase